MFSIDPGRTALAATRRALHEHAVLTGLVGAYFLAAVVVSRLYGLPYGFGFNFGGYATLLFVPLAFAFCWHAVKVMIFVRPEQLTLYLLHGFRQGGVSPCIREQACPINQLVVGFDIGYVSS